jgi:hypothetical protein
VKRTKEDSRRRRLIALPDKARMIAVNNHIMRGGYATIRMVCIEGTPGIEAFREFATEISNQNLTRPDPVILEHQNKSMAMTIPHAGVI